MGLLADRPLRLLQPTRLPEIDWRNPITRGLVLAFDGQRKADVTRDRRFETASGLIQTARNGKGAGYSVTGTSTVAQQPGIPFSGTSITMFALVSYVSGMQLYAGLIGSGNGSTCTTMYFNSTELRLNSNSTSGGGLGVYATVGTHSYGITHSGTSTTGWFDGVKKQTAGSVSLNVPSGATWLIGATNTDYPEEYFPGVYLAAMVWSRALSDGEMRSLHASPWQIFKAPLRLLPSSGVAPQYLAPVSDVAAGSWLPSTGSDLYAMLDETTYSDADYIYATSATTCTLAIASGSDPGVSTGHILRYRLPAGSGKIAVALKQSTTTIASWGPHTLTGAAQDFAQTLSAGEADSITNYGALRVEFTSSL